MKTRAPLCAPLARWAVGQAPRPVGTMITYARLMTHHPFRYSTRT